MKKVLAIAILAVLGAPAGAHSQVPDIATLAQALDRCMASYAVRMGGTDATDETIFMAATDGCRQIETDLFAAVRRDAPAQADAAIGQWTAQARPNFFALLQRIRSDRAAQSQQ